MIKIEYVNSKKELKIVRELFMEYADSLNFNLEFQDFKSELKNLPGDYAQPSGCLLLAYDDDLLCGCVALRKFRDKACEMKRLYIKPCCRGKGIGKALAIRVIEEAYKKGYKKMVLDTIDTMQAAIALYRGLGFKEIKPYRENPVPGARFFKLDLI